MDDGTATWPDILMNVLRIVKTSQRGATRFYRGHSDATWKLLPGIGRVSSRAPHLEDNLFFAFVNRGATLLDTDTHSWNNIFAMQHHGLPTRLLDWTESFAIALFFALREGDGDAAVWVLDPFRLNEKTRGSATVIDHLELDDSYYNFFMKKSATFAPDVIEITPPARHPRVFHQKGGFTLHGKLNQPLEDLHPDVLTKITIPAACRNDAGVYLDSAGISEFSLFPDLDGLAREVRGLYLKK